MMERGRGPIDTRCCAPTRAQHAHIALTTLMRMSLRAIFADSDKMPMTQGFLANRFLSRQQLQRRARRTRTIANHAAKARKNPLLSM
jgi:hypothetical protein